MFKKHTTQLFFYGLLFVSGLVHSAADDPEEYTALKSDSRYPTNTQGPDNFDPLGLRAQSAARHKESLKSKRIIPDEEFDQILARHATDLPSLREAESAIHRIVKQHSALNPIIQCIKNPNLCQHFTYPSQLLFFGPSGCGKTYAAKALAKYCDAECIFIKGSAVGNTYQNSGSTFITNLFKGILERPEKRFMVIIDEFMAVARFVDDDEEMQQNKTAMALWKALDGCTQKKHACVIGTDHGDPEKLTDAFKTRFAYDIFVFHHMQKDDILAIVKECLGKGSSNGSYACSDEYLAQFAQSVEHLSLREIEDLIEKTKMLAISESQNPDAEVTEQHLMRIFETYREPNWLEKVWINLLSTMAVLLALQD